MRTSRHVQRRRALTTAIAAMMAVVTSLLLPAAARAEPIPGGPYWIYNVYTQMCLDLPGYGGTYRNAPVTQYFCNHPDNQRFYLTFHHYDAGSAQNLYWIQHDATFNFCLDLPGYGWVAPATKVSIYNCRSNDNQLWRLYQLDPGGNRYQIVHDVTGMCLDVPGIRDPNAFRRPDIRLELYHCASPASDDHEWRLEVTLPY
jgi:hypothetical protein